MNPIDLLTEAERLLDAGRPEEALPLLSRAARAAGSDRFFLADVLFRRAEALRALSRYEQALMDYWEAHRLYRRCGVASERLRTLLGASACLRVLSRYRQADRMWRSVARLLPSPVARAADPSSEEFQLEIALVRRGLGDMAGATRLLRTAIPRLEKKKDSEALQHAWWSLAGAERFAGRYGEALKAFAKADVLARKNGDPSAAAYAWCGMGGCLRILGRVGESLAFYRRAHAYFMRSKDRFGEAYGLCGMANSLRTYGDPRKAIPLYRRSAALYEKVGDPGSRAFALWGLGGSHRRLGQYPEALEFYREALRDFKKVGDTRGVLMALLGLGKTFGETARRDQAERFLSRARVLAEKEKHPYEAALSRLEMERVQGRPLTVARFPPFGVKSTVVSSWKDLP